MPRGRPRKVGGGLPSRLVILAHPDLLEALDKLTEQSAPMHPGAQWTRSDQIREILERECLARLPRR